MVFVEARSRRNPSAAWAFPGVSWSYMLALSFNACVPGVVFVAFATTARTVVPPGSRGRRLTAGPSVLRGLVAWAGSHPGEHGVEELRRVSLWTVATAFRFGRTRNVVPPFTCEHGYFSARAHSTACRQEVLR